MREAGHAVKGGQGLVAAWAIDRASGKEKKGKLGCGEGKKKGEIGGLAEGFETEGKK